MEDQTTIKLPSNAELNITMASFTEARDLYQAILNEAKVLKISKNQEVEDLVKDLLCSGFSSKNIEEKLWVCMRRATYNKAKITEDTFEPVEARGDYLVVCMEVARFNVFPFMKSLFAEYKTILNQLVKDSQG